MLLTFHPGGEDAPVILGGGSSCGFSDPEPWAGAPQFAERGIEYFTCSRQFREEIAGFLSFRLPLDVRWRLSIH